MTSFVNVEQMEVQIRDRVTIGVLVGGIFLVLAGGIWLLIGDRKSPGGDRGKAEDVNAGLEKGDLGYQEPQTKVTVGSKAISRGTFMKAEGGKIYFTEEGVMTVLPLTEEVSLQCTDQDLEGVTEYDFEQVTKIMVVGPGELNDKVAAGEPVVVLANLEGTEYKANTVAISAEGCGKI
ncbi:MAG: hypothetical protein UY33_C0038G0005 [Candidatus Amesbacteria bacterium GW2011_GWA1_48_9]|uniref:Uncharacterized protein n=1 Tax=Candidatus Amesbacteria bacterium GW2011_GWA1_48_9 TaxID=1618355 RepID=A0A0G1UY99_9BACT|nr:MAG: hypothetical protein UY33_C0038G0005 [Candidatus Amesbacteria bacterium GW2011_GWA1_48_9]